jgi:hypothetical protein
MRHFSEKLIDVVWFGMPTIQIQFWHYVTDCCRDIYLISCAKAIQLITCFAELLSSICDSGRKRTLSPYHFCFNGEGFALYANPNIPLA